MSTAPARRFVSSPGEIPSLVNGDRLSQAEFHKRYEMYDEDQKWELVGGIVYMASPLGRSHYRYDGKIGLVLELYEAATPGLEVMHNGTVILSDESEPQPDLGLRILPEFGGQSRNRNDYVEGAPELVAEIAHSTSALDMHAKRNDYRAAGVLEYLVVCVREQEVHWFHFPSARPIRPDRQGISRSRAFPGLWLDPAALLVLDSPRLRDVIEQGVASKAHAAFVKRLERQHRRHSQGR
jgi:Uma2 family endonuclease